MRITTRVAGVALLAGLASGAIATAVASRAVRATAEARLVEATTGEAARAASAIADRLAIARAQLATAAVLAETGRIQEVPGTLAEFVAALRVEHDGEVLELARVEALRGALPDPRPIVDGRVAIAVARQGVRATALVDVASLLPQGEGRSAELAALADPRLVAASVVVRRDDELASAVARVGDALELHYAAPLGEAQAEVRAAVLRATGVTAAVALALSLAIAWLLARRVTLPIRRLAAAVRRDAFVLPPLPSDEIGELGDAIGAMHAALAQDAALAREVIQLQDAEQIIAALGRAIASAHPRWRLVLGSEPPIDCITVAIDDEGVALGPHDASIDEVRSVEVLCLTAVSALRGLALARAAHVNDQLALLGKVAAGVAHEINNPLAYVSLNLGILDALVAEGEPRELLRETIGGIERVAQIVRDLGQLSRRGSAAKVAIEDLAQLAAEQLKVARVRRHDVELVLDAPAPVWASCARGRVAQALLNLIVNAIDATAGRHGARVEVRVRAEAAGPVLEVRDNGPGIPEKIRRKLFDAFTTTKGEHGTGLGLHLSRQFVREQGGELEVVASGATGTVFALRLPAAPAPGVVEAIALPEGSSPIAARRKVLIIDDEPQILSTLQRWLSQYVDVVTAAGGRDGIARFAEASYALVLCDWNMPGGSGRDFVAAVRADKPHALDRVVIMTGGIVDDELPVRVMAKPLDRAVIKELLRV